MGTVATFVRVKKWALGNMPASFREYQYPAKLLQWCWMVVIHSLYDRCILAFFEQFSVSLKGLKNYIYLRYLHTYYVVQDE